jgi:adenosylhomocysteine nucleosidase
MEAGAMEDRLRGVIAIRGGKYAVRQGGLKGRGIVVIHSGIGQKKAGEATEMLIAGHRPGWVISAGLAGGLREGVKREDIVMPDAILGEDGRRLTIDYQLAPTPGVHVGPLVTVDRVVFKPQQKRELGEQTGAMAVDMETLAVAEVCRREKQRFLAVRVISDAVNDELPPDVERLLTKKTFSGWLGAAAGSVLRRPSAAKDLWRLRETALVCSIRLAKFLEQVIGRLD